MAPGPTGGWALFAGVSVRKRGLLGAPLARVGIANSIARSFSVSGGTASFGLVTGIAEACPISLRLLPGGLFRPCVVGEYGVLEAIGADTLDPRSVSRPWWSAGLEGRFALHLFGPISLDASVAVLLAFARDRFAIGPDVVFETPVTAGRAFLGIGMSAP